MFIHQRVYHWQNIFVKWINNHGLIIHLGFDNAHPVQHYWVPIAGQTITHIIAVLTTIPVEHLGYLVLWSMLLLGLAYYEYVISNVQAVSHDMYHISMAQEYSLQLWVIKKYAKYAQNRTVP